MLILLPLEPLEERYTMDWYLQFPRELKKLGVKYLQVDGEKLTSKIELGSVLDCYGTSYWKSTQIAHLLSLMRSKKVTSDDTILLADAWYPGLECLQYIGCQGGEKPKITGILHAGSYDPFDFVVRTGMRSWAHNLEQVWIQSYNLIFVATQFHKNLILKSHYVDPNKIKVTGIPFYPDEIIEPRKGIKKISQRIVFPHREDIEKQPQEFEDLMRMLGQEFPEMTYMMTGKHRDMGKKWFYDELAKAEIAVSMAQQETFGYSMVEAVSLGCVPLVPDRLSYSELYLPQFKYKSVCDLVEKLKSILSGNMFPGLQEQIKIHKDIGENAISKMVSYLR